MLISNAYAQAASGGGGDMLSLLPIILMFVVLYFLMIRPQMKRAKEHKAMIEALAKGDEVVTAGGLVGRVTKLTDAYVGIEVSNNVEVTVQRPSIQLVLPKGTIKGI
jgi:preprotein translocase subunit YajC